MNHLVGLLDRGLLNPLLGSNSLLSNQLGKEQPQSTVRKSFSRVRILGIMHESDASNMALNRVNLACDLAMSRSRRMLLNEIVFCTIER